MPNRAQLYLVECPACGRYRITASLGNWIRDPSTSERNERHKLSAATRRASARDEELELTSAAAISELFATAPERPHVLALMDRLLIAITERVDSYNVPAVVAGTDYPVYGLRDSGDLERILIALSDQDLIKLIKSPSKDEHAATPTISGWQYAREIQSRIPQTDQAFVAMWFDPSVRSAFVDGIAPALRACGYRAYRVDFEEFNTKIDDAIIAELRRSAIAVVDFTGHRRSVYFEAGFGWGLGIPVIATCHADQIGESSFDYRQYSHVLWTTPAELRERLEARLRATVPIHPALSQ